MAFHAVCCLVTSAVLMRQTLGYDWPFGENGAVKDMRRNYSDSRRRPGGLNRNVERMEPVATATESIEDFFARYATTAVAFD
jgi:hypothetical protein